ncbi:MAG: alpha/beta hydrolase [Candidatus Promineifilaceae bacterium]|nr:alpha/beta hydrolase [Candidatus Promineifilaceae bacterium]
MSTLSGQKIDVQTSKKKNEFFMGRKIGSALFSIFGGLVALISLLPVILLPFITAVPLALCLLLALADVGLLVLLLARAKSFGTRTVILFALVLVSVLAVLLSQWYAATPQIVGTDGQPLPGSIAELEQVQLNGRQQWITIRGQDAEKPMLLFLAGGPGGSQLAATRKQLADLEEHFVVVNWDQPGAGKSYRAADFSTLEPQQYVTDALALTQYLRQRFGQDKIYIMGESWGSLLGIWISQEKPEWVQAFVGAAQMVAFLPTDLYDYELALQIARERGDDGKTAALEQQGPPPYYGDGVAMKVTEYILYLSSYMNGNPQIHADYDTFGDIAAPEYGLYDKVNYIRGLLQTMEVLWPQLWEVDLRRDANQLEVPVYFLEGRHDVNAPPYLVEDYLQALQAPHKELIWFENSGHSPWVEESQKVVDVLVNKVQAQMAPEAATEK